MASPSQSNPREPSVSKSPRPGLLPSPFTHSDEVVPSTVSPLEEPQPVLPTTASIYSHDPINANEYVEPQNGELLPPPSFAPFFTMISDSETGETYHPSTYYVFADDEPDVLSQAALHALDSYSAQAQEEAEMKAQADGLPKEEERYVMLSLDANGTGVSSVKSLALNWAVTSAEVRTAPTFDGDGMGGDGLMLVVEGMGIAKAALEREGRTEEEREQKAKELFGEARRKGGGTFVGAMEELANGMVGGIGTLDKIINLE